VRQRKKKTADPSTALGMTKGRGALPFGIGSWDREMIRGGGRFHWESVHGSRMDLINATDLDGNPGAEWRVLQFSLVLFVPYLLIQSQASAAPKSAFHEIVVVDHELWIGT
jgi:hypothetical protein